MILIQNIVIDYCKIIAKLKYIQVIFSKIFGQSRESRHYEIKTAIKLVCITLKKCVTIIGNQKTQNQ